MGEFRDQATALAAQTLKDSAARENVYISLKRAAAIVAPVIDVVGPLLAAGEAIEQARAAAEAEEGSRAAAVPQRLIPADELVLRRERLQETLRRIARAAELHDLGDIALHELPAELRTVMAAYADCQQHLRKASSLLASLAQETARPRTQRVAPVQCEVQIPQSREAERVEEPELALG